MEFFLSNEVISSIIQSYLFGFFCHRIGLLFSSFFFVFWFLEPWFFLAIKKKNKETSISTTTTRTGSHCTCEGTLPEKFCAKHMEGIF